MGYLASILSRRAGLAGQIWDLDNPSSRGYARTVLATRPNTAEDEIENLVAARLARQEVLTGRIRLRCCCGAG
jgi:hypothetical protein